MSKKKRPIPPSPLEAALPPGGADTHAHLDMEPFAADLPEVLERAFACGVSHIGNVFLGSEAYERGRRLFDAYPQVFFLIGIHPNEALDCTEGELARLKEIARADARVKAIGEIGLDFFWEDCPPETQHRAFRAQIALARGLDLPLVIHSRDATEATLAVLEEEKLDGYPLLWHCFGGDAALAELLIRQGRHISVPGPVGYPANNDLREACRRIPLDRLLLETDAPYLSPLEWRGKRNEPAFTVFTARRIALERNMDPAELWTACGVNARRFFGL